MLNWGLIGCGDIANKRVAQAIKSQAQSKLLGVMSPYPSELEAFKEKHGIERAYLNIEEILKDDDISTIYVATPIFLHYENALNALRHGKHVLVEKPMAMTNQQCEELIAEARKNNVKLGVAYYRRFFPKLQEVKRIIKDGVIGDIVHIRIIFHSWYNPDKNDPKYWRVVKSKSGGGPLWDMGCHKYDMMVELIGMPKTVFAVMDTMTHSYEVEDSCSALFEMENGSYCLSSFNWNSKVWADEFEILGTEGKIILNPCDSDNIEVQLVPKLIKGMGKEVTSVIKANHANVHFPLVDDFAKAILENRQPRVSGEEGYKTNKILSAIEESSYTGKKVKL